MFYSDNKKIYENGGIVIIRKCMAIGIILLFVGWEKNVFIGEHGYKILIMEE